MKKQDLIHTIITIAMFGWMFSFYPQKTPESKSPVISKPQVKETPVKAIKPVIRNVDVKKIKQKIEKNELSSKKGLYYRKIR
jgi:hypothetical protein